MKKNLLQFICLTFVTALCVSNLFAQAKETLVDVEGWTHSGISKSYDRQTQGSVYPMTQRHDDGFIGSTWTNEDNPPFPGSSTPLRGIGYSYSTDGGITWSEQENRVGGIPIYWPSYAQWGANGEAILGRSADTYEYEGVQIINGLVLLTRPNKGVGAWTIRSIPYPIGCVPSSNCVMAWAQMTTSGHNHQYIHIMSPMTTPEGQPYKGYKEPVFYYRTQDGLTWDVEGQLVPEMVGQEWATQLGYTHDKISFAVQGNNVACSFIRFGMLANYVLKSRDNGNTWESIPFFTSSVGYYGSPSISTETVYIPTQGCIALDNNGKIHVAFGVLRATNTQEEGVVSLFTHFSSSFLSYWNEDMQPINGDVDFRAAMIDLKVFDEYFDFEQSNDSTFYVKSTVPKWPVIGYYTPTRIEHLYTINVNIISEWATRSYGLAGCFSFPQMAFDANNKLHLVYLGLLDNGKQGNRWLRHPFYTTRTANGEWSKTEYLVNHLDYIDKEFAYLTLAGLGNNKMYLMAQVDNFAGTNTTYLGGVIDHNPTDNYFTYFSVTGIPTQSIEHYEKTPLKMSLFPNPATKQATVKFEGKGNITITNMLGQTVYHVENVENKTQIPLNNMNTGVYFVTVRSGSSIATQKLIVN